MVELAGGDIDWDQIDPDTLPPEIINIINGTDNPDYINLADLKAQVDANTGSDCRFRRGGTSRWRAGRKP